MTPNAEKVAEREEEYFFPDASGPGDDLEAVARRTGFSPEAVVALRAALVRGGGRMAQFSHPEFGGLGQWMRGGMVMTSAHDRALEQRIDRLCDALGEAMFAKGPAAQGGGDEAACSADVGSASRPPDRSDAEAASPPGADPLTAIERLAALHARGIVTAAEYAAKKAELLARI